MTMPIVRGFSERLFLVLDDTGQLGWTVDEAEARREAKKPGYRLAVYSFVRELHVDRSAANESPPPWEDLPPEPDEARP